MAATGYYHCYGWLVMSVDQQHQSSSSRASDRRSGCLAGISVAAVVGRAAEIGVTALALRLLSMQL